MKLNHILIRSKELNKIAHFFEHIIGLEKQDRPPFPFRGAWFGSENIAMVHVAEDPSANSINEPMHHFAIEGGNYKKLISTLEEEKIKYFERSVPLSGDRQVFVNGPDGVLVEMMFPHDKADGQNHPY